MLPVVLSELVLYLTSINLSLTNTNRDGRINSAINESEVLNIIHQKFEIEYPKKRDWKDFSITDVDGKYIPVNIKVAETITTDNLNCKIGIYYALTGKLPTFDNQIDWGNYLEKLRNDICENDLDYYFLIINKNKLNDIYVTSLKLIKNIVPNGNNLPFQAKWSDNKTLVKRSFNDAKDYILITMGKSFKLRSKVYEQFLNFFPEYEDLV